MKTIEVVIPKDPWIRLSVAGVVVRDPQTGYVMPEDEFNALVDKHFRAKP